MPDATDDSGVDHRCPFERGSEPQSNSALPDLGLLARIRSEIRAFQASRSDGQWNAEMQSRVAQKIGVFLGKNGARMLLRPVADDGGNLLSTIEPVLAEFLGQRAASELVSHVIDTSIVDIECINVSER